MDNGWISLHRKSLNSSVWATSEIWMVWSWCLLKATHKQSKFFFNGSEYELKPGEFMTGRSRAIEELPITPRKWRTAIDYLKATHRISVQTTKRFSKISIIKWESYQKDKNKRPSENDDKRPTNDQQTTTYNNDNKEIINTGVVEMPKNDLLEKMYDYSPWDDDGNATRGKRIRLTKQENNFLISIGFLWQELCSQALGVPKDQIIMQRIYFPIRQCYIKNKFTKKEFKKLFDFFLKSPSIKYEDKMSFDLCLSEKYVGKYKLAQRNRNITNAEVIGEIIL